MVFGSRVAPFLVLHFYSLLTLHNPATAAVTLVTLGRTSQMLFVLLYFLCAARPVLYSIPSRSPTSHCCWTASSSFRSANFRSITDNRCDHSTKHLIRFITKLTNAFMTIISLHQRWSWVCSGKKLTWAGLVYLFYLWVPTYLESTWTQQARKFKKVQAKKLMKTNISISRNLFFKIFHDN